MDPFRPRCPAPVGLVVPVRVDRLGVTGPTSRQASGPRWRRTTPGRAVPVGTPTSVEQRILEESQRLPTGGAVGGWAALRLHGTAYFDGRDDDVPLVVPRPHTLAARSGVRVVRPAGAPQVQLRHGIPCVDAVTALLDVVHREPRLRHRVVAVDMALAAGVVTRGQLAPLARRPGVARLREALPLVDGRSASPMESWLRLVWVLDARLPTPLSNWPLFGLDGLPLGRPDLVADSLSMVAEYDGSAHAGTRRRRADAERRDAFRGVGLEVVTVVGGGWGREAPVARQLLEGRQRSLAWHRPRLWRLGVL